MNKKDNMDDKQNPFIGQVSPLSGLTQTQTPTSASATTPASVKKKHTGLIVPIIILS